MSMLLCIHFELFYNWSLLTLNVVSPFNFYEFCIPGHATTRNLRKCHWHTTPVYAYTYFQEVNQHHISFSHSYSNWKVVRCQYPPGKIVIWNIEKRKRYTYIYILVHQNRVRLEISLTEILYVLLKWME